jgi:hypothetical protein
VEKRPIVIDAGPLLTYLALQYLNSNDTPKASRDQILREIRPGSPIDEPEQERLRQLLRQPAFTTAHVIAEVLKLREKSLLSRIAGEFRRHSLDILIGGAIREVPCPIEEMCREKDFRQLVCDYGIADAGLIFAAYSMRALVLTDDRRLFRSYSVHQDYVIELLDNYLRQPA